MKTEQEQIEAIYNLIISHLFEDTVYSIAEQIYKAGYGDVSEYKAENERLTKILNSLTFSKKETDIFGKPALLMFAGVKVEEAIKRVTEYNGLKAEIERLKSENEKLKTKCDDFKKLSDWQREEIKMLKAEVNKGCDNCETIKQGQVDVLKELKTRHDYAIKNMGYPWDISQEIDELIKEVENDK